MAKRRFSLKFVTREGSAFMVATHLVGGIIAGTLLGYLFDGFFKTEPWGLIVGFLLGVVAGFKNAYVEMKRALEKEDSNPRP
jgi:ATP synthase protein I